MKLEIADVPPRTITDRITAHVWWFFGAWLAMLATIHAMIWAGHGWAWFPEGVHLLFSSSWSHLYAQHNDLQIGPLTFVVTAPIVYGLPPLAGEVTAVVLMAATGLVVLAQIRALLPARTSKTDRAYLLAGMCFLVLWAELSVTFAHADDVLAILFTVLALRGLRTERPDVAALLLALAADCKPWAVMFVPLLLLAKPGRRARAGLIWFVTIAAAWLPFYLADHRTLSVGGYRIANDLSSSLRVLGENAASTPSWARPAQMLLAIVLGLVVLRQHRWSAVVLVAVAARLLLDPGVNSYYDASLLTGTVLCDLLLFAGPIPFLSLSAVLVFYLPMFPLHAHHHLYGLIRTAYLVTVILTVTLLPARTESEPLPRVRDPGAT